MPLAAVSWTAQSSSQDVTENDNFNGVQESIQIADASDNGIFVVQSMVQEAGLNDLDVSYTTIIDQDNRVFLDSNAPADVKKLLDDFKSNYDKIGVVACKIAFPEILIEDREPLVNPPDEPKTIKDTDTQESIIILIERQWDYGDVPDRSYHTLFASNGARHVVVPCFYLGQKIDAEIDGQSNANATGDDINGTDDDDGVVFTNPIIPGTEAFINVTASYPGILSAWMDFNGDGDWGDEGEKMISDQELEIGDNRISFDLPATAMQGSAYVRFRFSSVKGLSFEGSAPDGEVEDYCVQIVKS